MPNHYRSRLDCPLFRKGLLQSLIPSGAIRCPGAVSVLVWIAIYLIIVIIAYHPVTVVISRECVRHLRALTHGCCLTSGLPAKRFKCFMVVSTHFNAEAGTPSRRPASASPHFSRRGEAKCVRGPSVRGGCRRDRQSCRSVAATRRRPIVPSKRNEGRAG